MVRLPDDDVLVVDEMLRRITGFKRRNAIRTAYVEGEKRLENLSVTVPPQMQHLATVVGWPKKAVEVLADRLHPEGWRLPRESDVFSAVESAITDSNFDVVEPFAIESALRHGCSFVITSRGLDSEVWYSVKSAEQATVLVDPRWGVVTAALEFVERDVYAYYTPDRRRLLGRSMLGWEVLGDEPTNMWGRTGVTPYTWDASANHPLGQSRITNSVMGLTEGAVRVMLRQEVSAEFYSSPQRYMLGADPEMFEDENGNLRPAWETLIGSLLVAPDHIDNETLERVTPTVGQFTQMSQQPHSDHLRTIAMMFSGHTSIPPSRLGILHDNPASAEAMLAEEADLITTSESHFPELSHARKGVFLDTAALLAPDSSAAIELRGLKSRWRDAGTPNAQSRAQATTMLVGSGVIPAQSRVTWEMMGFDDDTIRRLEAEARRLGNSNLLQSLQAAADQAAQDPVVAELSALAVPGADQMDPAALKQRFDALGVAIRAGVEPEWAAQRLGLDGAEFTGAVPVQLRMPERDTAFLEER